MVNNFGKQPFFFVLPVGRPVPEPLFEDPPALPDPLPRELWDDALFDLCAVFFGINIPFLFHLIRWSDPLSRTATAA